MTDPFGIFEQAARANPQAIYARMRREAPTYRAIGPVTGNTFWFLTRYEDCVAVLKDQRFGKEIRKHLPPEMLAQYPEDEGVFTVINRHLLNLDPPDHTRLRSLVHKAFTPGIVENLRPRIQQIADDLLDQIQQRSSREFDLLSDYGFLLPITVIAELLGVPFADRERFREWTKVLLFSRDVQTASIAGMEFIGYMNDMIAERRTQPREDLLSGLIHIRDEGQQLDHAELLAMIFLLLVAGHETTVNLIGNGTLALLQHPDQLQKLKENPSLIKSAVEEMLRYNGPVETTTLRWAFEDTEISGVRIPQGDIVLVSLLAANRDPEQFTDPDRFDIARENNKHIAFGSGIHFCLGAPLARMEGAIALNTLLARLPTLSIDPAVIPTLEWNDSLLLHGMKSLPVCY
jgi:cytochrome P450